MGKPRRRRPNRLERLIATLRRRCEQTVPESWLDEPPADPDIGVREPRGVLASGSDIIDNTSGLEQRFIPLLTRS